MTDLGTLGKYRLLQPITQGGMAEIFLAKQEGPAGFAKTVVIKRVLPHLSKDSEFIQMFLDEARLAARLSHPNIVQMYDFGEVDGAYFLCMEHLAGEDLSEVLRVSMSKGRPLPAAIAAMVVSAACDGLHYAHTLLDDDGRPLRIVHRDISPSNIFVTYQGAVKVLDFGIAKAEGKIVRTDAGRLKGKLQYMSPEQVGGKTLDNRSDVFALGIVLYHIVTGIRPFQREEDIATFRAILDDTIVPPRTHRPDVPAELEDVIFRALERDITRRFQSADELRRALDVFLSSRTTASAASSLRKYMRDQMGEERARTRTNLPTPSGSMRPPATPSGSTRAPATPSGSVRVPTPAGAARPPTPAGGGQPPGNPTVIRQASDGKGAVPPQPAAARQATPAKAGYPAAAPAAPPPAEPELRTPTGGAKKPDRAVQALPAIAPSKPGGAPNIRLALMGGGVVVALAIGGFALLRSGNKTPVKEAPKVVEVVVPAASPDAATVQIVTPVAPVLPIFPETPDAGSGADIQPVVLPLPGPALPSRVADASVPELVVVPKNPGTRKVPPGGSLANRGPQGYLDLNCVPWCKVYVDDLRPVDSPVKGMKLTAGVHRVRVENPQSGMKREREITVLPNETTKELIRF